MNPLDQQESLLQKLFVRRKVELFQGVRRKRNKVAEKMAARGLLQSGAFVSAVTHVYVTGYESFARSLIKDTFDFMHRSNLVIDAGLARWMTDRLDPLLRNEADNVCKEAAEKELQESVQRAMEHSLAGLRRDLAIELDLVLITQSRPPARIDPESLDELVPLQKRRGLEQAFVAATKNEPGHVACLVSFDIDKFKDVNDKNGGHAIGDEALVAIAEVAAACVKGKGEAFRVGGDEFILLLPNHILQEGLAVAERFRREVGNSPRTSRNLKLSVSVGVAVYPEHGADLDALKIAADLALYDAKQRGRDLVRYSGEGEPAPATTREPERKAPEPGGLSDQEKLKIKQDYFRNRVARCPRDGAVLRVEELHVFPKATTDLIVICPMCGLNTDID